MDVLLVLLAYRIAIAAATSFKSVFLFHTAAIAPCSPMPFRIYLHSFAGDNDHFRPLLPRRRLPFVSAALGLAQAVVTPWSKREKTPWHVTEADSLTRLSQKSGSSSFTLQLWFPHRPFGITCFCNINAQSAPGGQGM